MRLTEAQLGYLPMSETAYYILLSLVEPMHGYGIIQHVASMTQERVRLGPGTLYGSLSRMVNDGLIQVVSEQERRKVYVVTDAGRQLLRREVDRLKELVTHGIERLEGLE